MQVPSPLLAGKTCIHISPFMFPQCYARADFCIFNSRVLDFCKKLSFSFCLVNFERATFLAVDHSLVYSYSKMLLLLMFISLILTARAWFITIFLDSYRQQIRYLNYCGWALKIIKFQQGDDFNHYNYPEEMLNYIRTLVQNDIKGKIVENLYKVSLKEFCEVLQIKLLKCFTGSCFWKIYWEKFAAKISF